jgi:tetratricopeptide (TPR) repeat protein
VCQAVQHAHQKGVIHRDLKPSNILIGLYDGQPVPKVIDFGVAKTVGARLTEHSIYTEIGMMVGTLEYMAPEQAELNNLDIDTRADIYALGVVLYELLTGSVPFPRKQLQDAGLAEMLRVIKEVEPPKPSTRLSSSGDLPSLAAVRKLEPKRLTKLVRGDLDWIAMKCLEKERARRYETANGLVADIQRYLADEPVLAGPPGAGYRLRKYARKHRAALAVAVAFALLLLAGTAVSAWQAVRATRAEGTARAAEAQAARERDEAVKQRERADQNLAKARQAVEQYLTSVAEDELLKQSDFHALRKKLLSTAVPYYEAFVAQKADDARLRAEQGRVYGELAGVRKELGENPAAEADYRRMEAVFAELAAAHPGEPAYRHGLAKSYASLGRFDLGTPLVPADYMRKAIDAYKKLAAEYPGVPDYRVELAGLYTLLGRWVYEGQDRANWSQAEEYNRRAVALLEEAVANSPDTAAYRVKLVSAYDNLCWLLEWVGRGSEVADTRRKALDIYEKLVADSPAVPAYRLGLASGHSRLGQLAAAGFEWAEAEGHDRQAVAQYEKLADLFPSVPAYRAGLALMYARLGGVLRGSGRRPEAEQCYRTAIAIGEKAVAAAPAMWEYRSYAAHHYADLGDVLRESGRGPEAEESYRKALDLFEHLPAGRTPVEWAATYIRLGDLLRASGRRPEAEELYRKAVAIHERMVAAAAPSASAPRYRLGTSYTALGNLLKESDRRSEADGYYRKALGSFDEYNRLDAEFVALAKSPEQRAAWLVGMARISALSSGVAEAMDDGPLAERYALQAVELLRRAIADGWKRVAQAQQQPDFDALRRRVDFQKLLKELEAK